MDMEGGSMNNEQAKYYCEQFFSLLTEEERELYHGFDYKPADRLEYSEEERVGA